MVKHKRLLIVSSVCVLLVSSILVWSASTRLLRAYNYASQFAAAPQVSVSGTNLSLVFYGADPLSFRQGLELFQLVKAQNIEWKGTSTDGQGNPANVAFKLGSVNFRKLNENSFSGNATVLDAHVTIDDLIDVTVKADRVDANITFWTHMGMFSAVNITGVLTGNVYLRLSVSVLPFLGLDFALYEFSGDKFTVSVCGMKPMNLIVQAPANNQRVSGDVLVQALIQAVPELSVENVRFWTDYGENMPMQYNQGNGLWECVWQTYHTGNGKHGLNVHAEAVDRKSGQEFRYPSDVGIAVDVNNPWVQSYVSTEQGLQNFGLNVKLHLDSNVWQQVTIFNFWPATGLTLEAPEYWNNGQVRFNCWRIDDEQGNTVYQSPDLALGISQEVFSKLFNGGGDGRELKCIYVPV